MGIITLGARSLIKLTPEIKTLSNSGLVSKRIIQSYENYAKIMKQWLIMFIQQIRT